MALKEIINKEPKLKDKDNIKKVDHKGTSLLVGATAIALAAAGLTLSEQKPVQAQDLKPTPTPEPPPPTPPNEQGETIPGVETGETLAMGGPEWHITRFNTTNLVSLLRQLKEPFTVIDNGNGQVINLSYFDSQSRFSIILPHAPAGYKWDGKNQVWINPKNPNEILFPQVALPGGWNQERGIAGPAVVPEVVLMLQDSQGGIRTGIIYNNEALKAAGIVDNQNVTKLDNNQSIFIGNPKNLELETGQRIEAVYDENNQILYHRVINPDGSWKKILTGWDQVINQQQVDHMFKPIGIQIGEEITDIPYPPDQLTNLTNPNAPIPQFINALRSAGINISPQEIVSGINQILPQAQERVTLSVKSKSLNLRSGPSTNEGIISSLPFNTVLTPTGERTADGWIKVQTADGKIGWVFGEYVTESISKTSSGGAIYLLNKESGTPLVDKDGNPFVVAAYKIDSSQLPSQYKDLAGPVPLLIAQRGKDGKWKWERSFLRNIAEMKGVIIRALSEFGAEPEEQIYRRILFDNFQGINISYDWPQVQPEPNRYDWEWPNYQFQMARNAGIKNYGIFHLLPNNRDAIPPWVNPNMDLYQVINSHITSLINNYKILNRGSLDGWLLSVVNESMLPEVRGRRDFFADNLGPNYIDYAFQIARQLAPEAVLIYNDSNNHGSQGITSQDGLTTRHTMEIVARLRQKGLIDGVGLQMHLAEGRLPNINDLINTIRAYQSLGVEVYITEFDLNLTNRTGSQQERFLYQANVVNQIIKALIKSGVRNIGVWNVADAHSWYGNPNSDPALFDDNGQPKMSYYAFLQALFNS